MSTAIVPQQQRQPAAAAQQGGGLATLQDLLMRHKDQIAMALPKHMTPERMIRVAMSAYGTTPGLAKCTPISVAACVVQSSILGLEPSSVLGESYLVPFWNGKTKQKECQLIPGYMGLLKLARQSGEVSMIDAQIVFANDQFEFHKGSEIWWRHKWERTGERGEPEGVWAGYVLKDGSRNFEYWTLEQIERHRDRYSKGAYDSDGKLTGAWKDSPEWMWKKTVLRQLIKLMPKSIELAAALSLDDRADAGVGQAFTDAVPVALLPPPGPEEDENTGAPPVPRRKTDALAQEGGQQ
jgi:recombination protein RecT